MLLDTNAGEKLAQWGAQSQQNKGFLAKLKKIINDLLNRLRSYFKNVDPESLAAKEFAKFDAKVKQTLAKMFVDMNIDAGEKLSTIKAAGMSIKNTAQQDGKQFKLGVMTQAEIQAVQNIGRVSVNAFSSVDIKATERLAQEYWKKMGVKSPFFRAWFGDWRVNDQKPIQIAKRKGDTRTDHTNKDTGWVIRNSGKVHDETKSHKSAKNREAVPYLPYIDEIIENAILLDTEGLGKKKSENSLLMHYLYAVADIGYGPEVLKLHVEEMYNPGQQDSGMRAYSLQNIEKAFAVRGRVQGNSPSSGTNTTNAIRNVADLFAAVKRMDADFQPNPVSGITNTDGTPKVMYHGSPAQFTIFDKKKAKSSGHYGRVFYFTDSQSHANTYGQLYSVYLNIRNPLKQGGSTVSRSQVRKFLEAVAENEDYSIENYGTYDVEAVLHNIMGNASTIDAYQAIQNVRLTAIGDMVEATELFNKVNGTKFDGIVAATETVAFYPEQIKSATDNIGTFDGSNPDIRYKLSVADSKFRGDFDYSGLNWAKDLGIITSKDTAIFERTINNEILRGAKPISANGEHIIDTGKCLMFTDGDFHAPTLSHVVVFETEYESLTADAKEMIYNDAKVTGDLQKSIEAIEKMFRPGFAILYDPGTGAANGRQNGRGKGNNSSQPYRRNRPRSVKEILAQQGITDFKIPVGDSSHQRQAGKETLTRYQEALRGQREDTRIMEQEFSRLARAFETQAQRSGKKDVAIDDLKAALKAEAKKHRDDQKLWEAEFNRLLRAYETSGRKIDRLEAQVAHQRQAAQAKVENRRKTEMRHNMIRKLQQ